MHQLPTGTVTLLFTDIQGSTQLLQRLGDRYTSVLEESRQLLRSAFKQWNGHEVDTQGDSFFVAFARATDAISAAVAAQRALTAHAWPEGETVRVRMGLHTGEPSLAAEGYVGMDVHHTARIMSAGHGGQVLISQVTRDLVEHHLPVGVSIRDMGEHRLKDLQRPTHLYQLIIAGLAADFPPLNILDTYPNNLPVQATPLIGREKEMTAIKQMLRHEDVRLVTLTGPGGTGKTRLALQVAADLSDLFPDGIYFVDLAPLSDPTRVIPIIAQTLGLRESENFSLLDCLKDELRQKRMLLLLDNFEQVIDAAVQVADLLASCSLVKILATSRAVLHLRAERELAVPPLSLPDRKSVSNLAALSLYEAIALFTQRAQMVKPEFRLTETNAPVVVEITTRLDGLPLAIELAAARMKLLSPEGLLARLSQRLQLLTSVARDVASRQQTLRNTIEWSYNLLDTQEQRLFRRLAIFAGGCTLEAAEAVCTLPGDEAGLILDSLTSLLDKSLVQQMEQGTEPRLTMLETIRDYALEALTASGEREAMRKAHATYFIEMTQKMAPDLWGLDQSAHHRIEQEHDNLRAAMQWSLEQENREIALRLGAALRPFWYKRGYFSEGLDFLEEALADREGADAPVLADALFSAARMNDLTGNIDRAESLIAESLALYQELGITEQTAYALHLQADLAWRKGNLSVARTQAEEALELVRSINDKGEISSLLSHLGVLAADQGGYVQARDLLEESLVIAREIEDTSSTADSLFNIARVGYLARGDLAEARAYLEEGFALHQALDDKESIAYCLLLSGLLDLEERDISSAHDHAEQAVTLFKGLKQWHGTALSTIALARVKAALGDDVQACTLYEESLTLSIKAGEKMIIASGLEGLADVVRRQGHYEWAARLWGAAEVLREALNAPIPPVEYPSYKLAVSETRIFLGESVFDASWMAGHSMSAEDALWSDHGRESR